MSHLQSSHFWHSLTVVIMSCRIKAGFSVKLSSLITVYGCVCIVVVSHRQTRSFIWGHVYMLSSVCLLLMQKGHFRELLTEVIKETRCSESHQSTVKQWEVRKARRPAFNQIPVLKLKILWSRLLMRASFHSRNLNSVEASQQSTFTREYIPKYPWCNTGKKK